MKQILWWLCLFVVPADGIGEDGGAAMAMAWLARAAIFVFVIYFTVFDAISGIGLGRAILTVQNLVTAGKQRNGIVGCFCGRSAFALLVGFSWELRTRMWWGQRRR